MRHLRVIAAITILCLVAPAPVASGRAQRTPGVSKDSIKIGVHGPATGAVPLPSESLQRGAEVFWKWRKERNRPIRGRHINVVFRNDNYNPSQAVAVCKEMVEEERVFLLSGLMNPEGKDQVQSCARYAASVNVPYVSLGTTQVGLSGLETYFAFSRSWPAQSRLLADYFRDRLGAKRDKNGMVRQDVPNYQDSHDAFVSAMDRKGVDLDYDRSVPKGAGQADAQTVVEELKLQEIENVFVLTTPTWFLQLLKAADSRNYHARWTGIGMTISSSDTVTDVGCRGNGAIAGARFLNPLPAFVDRDDFDPTYAKAMKRLYSDRGDMITWLGWGTSRQLAKLLKRAGRKLTRARFVRRTERARRVRTGILPALNFNPNDHFGGRGVHVLGASCRLNRWRTVERFKRGF